MKRAVIWSGDGEDKDGDWHVEFAHVDLADRGLRATGTQLGAVPVPYRLEYHLDATGEGFVTRSLTAEATGAGWRRRLRLERYEDGEWSAEAEADGALDMPAPGGDTDLLSEALDCDLGLSPLTNAMPVHRHSLTTEAGQFEFLMTWVSVPDLAIRPSRQRYTHIDRDAAVRFEELEGEGVTFTSDLEFADDGLVRVYPKLTRRVT
jgi:uncharacterized protein